MEFQILGYACYYVGWYACYRAWYKSIDISLLEIKRTIPINGLILGDDTQVQNKHYINSSLIFEFDATDDYDFILELWSIAREYIRFLCYRRNIKFSRISIWAPSDDGKHEEFANMKIIGLQSEQNREEETLQKGRYIKQLYVSGHEGEILSDIASNNLYLRHLPKTYKDGRHIDAARFIMIMGAFEWEYGRLHPEGVKKSETKIKAEDANEKLDYKQMGNRLASQRNHFAHGDLDKEFIGLSLLDLIFMEFVIYAMQMKYYKVSDENVRKAINELFQRGFAI